MSVLACASNANPTTYYWAEAGQGAATTIQSPVVVLPDAQTDASLTVNAGSAAGTASLSVVAGASSTANIFIGGGGTVYETLVPGSGANQGHLQITVQPTQVGQTPVFDYNATTSNLILGDSLAAGSVQIDSSKLLVSAAPFNGNAVQVQSVTATTGAILNTCASGGGLSLGSSVAFPSTLLVADVAGAARVGIGGNTGSTLLMTGGVGASQVSIINTSAAAVGSLLLGPSVLNDRAIFLNDTAGTANSAVVDITKGTATGIALRLQGYGTGTAAVVSTNSALGVLNVSSGPSDASPAIVISPTALTINRNQTVFAAPTVGSGSYGITQQIINSGNPIGTTAYALTNPALAGIYTIMVRVGDNAAVNINGQIDSVGYWDGTVWVAGAVNISPPLGTGNLLLWFGPTATARSTLLLQNTGSAALSGVAVYMIPQLIGLSSIIT